MLSKDLLTEKQSNAITFMYERDYSLMSLPMGFGKTVCTLTALEELRLAEGFTALVVAPLRVCDVWVAEAEKWAHITGSVRAATGKPASRAQVVESNPDVLVINFENIAWLFRKYPSMGREVLVIDEMTKVKNPGGEWFKTLRYHADRFTIRTGLTGSMAAENLEGMYGMARLLDGGAALGRRKDRYMETYFTPLDYERRRWEPKPGAAALIAERVRPFTFIEESGDDQNLPPLEVTYRKYTLSPKLREVYTQMDKNSVVEESGSLVTAVNAAVKVNKLQQICSGFIYGEDGAVRLAAEKSDCVGAEVTKWLDAGRHVLVVYQFVEELTMAKKLWPDAPIIGGGVPTGIVEQTIKDWNCGNVPVLLLHPKSAGHGLNLQHGGNVVVFFSPIWSNDQTRQVVARIHRRGVPFDRVNVTVCMAEDTVEDDVIFRVVEKQLNNEAFMDAVKQTV